MGVAIEAVMHLHAREHVDKQQVANAPAFFPGEPLDLQGMWAVFTRA
jgi:hypothetical protein